MADFIKKNKFLAHVITEICCLALVVSYIMKTNRNTNTHLQFLEQKLYQYEAILDRHERSLDVLMSKHVSFREPLKVYSPKPEEPLSPPPQDEDDIVMEELMQFKNSDMPDE